MAKTKQRKRRAGNPAPVSTYKHTEAKALLRPDVGTLPQFKKKKPPVTYRYDSSLAPELNWDGQNPAREVGEWLIACIEEASRLEPPHKFPAPKELRDANGSILMRVVGLDDAVEHLKHLSRPFLDWSGKAERLSFDVPTLPLFVHERLSTRAIIETLKGHKRDKQIDMFELFADPRHSIADQVLRAYEHQNGWTNRMILGDSLVVMNSLLHYEGLGGQVQMIYIDPPYGVKFGSNFQPFVRKRDVKHNDDEDMTREPEMVKAYRDTWELGLHSYLTYMRDRLLLARELLHPSGSVFVQISDENVHHVREVMDEVFGNKNHCATIAWKKASPESATIRNAFNYLLWYGKDIDQIRVQQLFKIRTGMEGTTEDPKKLALWADFPDETTRTLTTEEKRNILGLPDGTRVFRVDKIVDRGEERRFPFNFDGENHLPKPGFSWRGDPEQMNRLKQVNRIVRTPEGLGYKFYVDDYPVIEITNLWDDTGGKIPEMIYAVQTNEKIIERCMLMATRPGDLILDPTCGSGTTAYVAEQWGRRWITIDVSRVPLALARQRLLTATFPYYELKDESRGPAGGFEYKRKQNAKGEEIGGIVPHITSSTIANNEPPKEEVLVDRPEIKSGITRVTGPFTVEATIPTPVDWEADGVEDSGAAQEPIANHIERMLEILRRSPVLHVGGGKSVTLKSIRPPAKTLSLHAEAELMQPDLEDLAESASKQPKLDMKKRPLVAIVFGPENGAVSEKLVYEAAREARAKPYEHLYVIGFNMQANARELVEKCEEVVGIAATYVQATPDILMGDLLKTMRSSQIFSVCGLPEVKLKKYKDGTYKVHLLGVDVFDPVEMKSYHRSGEDVPAWFLDTDYNGLCFHVSQAFFPRTGAWDNLKKALRATHEESVWDHLAGAVSAPFEAGENGQIAVKVIDDRGNELMVVKKLDKAE
jgi:adenine-specific DNA-methyltransferase